MGGRGDHGAIFSSSSSLGIGHAKQEVVAKPEDDVFGLDAVGVPPGDAFGIDESKEEPVDEKDTLFWGHAEQIEGVGQMSHTRRKRLLVRPNSGLKDAPISKRARRDCKTSPFVRASASTAKPELQDGADFKTRGVGLDGIISVGSQLGLTTEDLSDVLGEPKDEAKTEEAEGLSSELPPVLRAAAEDPRGLLETIVDSDSDGAASGERRPAEALVAEASPEALAARLRACAAALASGKARAAEAENYKAAAVLKRRQVAVQEAIELLAQAREADGEAGGAPGDAPAVALARLREEK
ncbi:unnamed protein product, partial [Prorocentrum cordatum]